MRLRWQLTQFFLLIGLLVSGCSSQEAFNPERLTIGVVSYGEGTVSVDKYERLQQYLAKQTRSIVDLEPAYNELQALEQIRRKNWSLAFAPPGLAAIAISQELYEPLFPLQGVSSLERSLIVVREDSQIQDLANLANTTVALGEPGSAAGYYLPLYDLYGLTLARVRFAPTPKKVLEWLSKGEVEAGALSENEFERYRKEFVPTQFRVLHKSRWIPAGLVLLAPTVERNQQENIKNAMNEAPSDIIGDAGYVPGAGVPNYQEFIKIVEKVKPLEKHVRQVPAVLTIEPKNATN
ncbi:phosphate/phosphite/phosphonate ABC transporter substrate-binding protein [Pleurocapsales cyanobacterium LEGE 06147]|nr:phosphate/phosphite/phosphonate ABC transporter substrate-binding protein [Pleurocapsales cyanobacterium LEGE 06147]